MIDILQTFLQGKTAIVISHHSEMLRLREQVHDTTPQRSLPVLARKEDLPRKLVSAARRLSFGLFCRAPGAPSVKPWPTSEAAFLKIWYNHWQVDIRPRPNDFIGGVVKFVSAVIYISLFQVETRLLLFI